MKQLVIRKMDYHNVNQPKNGHEALSLNPMMSSKLRIKI